MKLNFKNFSWLQGGEEHDVQIGVQDHINQSENGSTSQPVEKNKIGIFLFTAQPEDTTNRKASGITELSFYVSNSNDGKETVEIFFADEDFLTQWAQKYLKKNNEQIKEYLMHSKRENVLTMESKPKPAREEDIPRIFKYIAQHISKHDKQRLIQDIKKDFDARKPLWAEQFLTVLERGRLASGFFAITHFDDPKSNTLAMDVKVKPKPGTYV